MTCQLLQLRPRRRRHVFNTTPLHEFGSILFRGETLALPTKRSTRPLLVWPNGCEACRGRPSRYPQCRESGLPRRYHYHAIVLKFESQVEGCDVVAALFHHAHCSPHGLHCATSVGDTFVGCLFGGAARQILRDAAPDFRPPHCWLSFVHVGGG
jgi:hypothetical protein